MADNDGFATLDETAERQRNDALPIFPFYLLVDVSGSMTPDIKTLNDALLEFRDRLRADPLTADCTLFGVLSFGSTAQIEIPLGDFAASDLDPNLLKINGSTRYSQAFRTLKATIERDLADLKQADRRAESGRDRFRYYRPAVFFLTDGDPDSGDPWQQAFTELTSMKSYPLFVPYGFRHATESVLRQLVHPVNRSKLYFARTTNVKLILDEMFDAMFVSILSSAQSIDSKPAHVLPDQQTVGKDIDVQQQYPDGDWM
jgi:uncharacterized protein YegL